MGMFVIGQDWKNCSCCLRAYEPYKIGEESELYGGWADVSLRNTDLVEKSEIATPRGLCAFCNPKSAMWYIPNKSCHAK